MKLKYIDGDEIPNIIDDLPTELPFMEVYSWVDEIKVTLDEGAIMPTRGHGTDCGFDLYAPKNMPTKYLWKGDSVVIDTGVHMLLEVGTGGIIISKSGLNTKHSITSTGLVDAQYTGSIKIKLYNQGDERYQIEPGDKISQIVIVPVHTPKLILAKTLPTTERNDRGFGSTGRK